MELGKLLTEGKGKRVYATDDPDQAIVYFKDEAMAFHGLKRGRILGKGEVNNAISEQFFKMLEENGIPTHYLRRLDARQSLVKRCQILPVSVKVRNRRGGVAGEAHRSADWHEAGHDRHRAGTEGQRDGLPAHQHHAC